MTKAKQPATERVTYTSPNEGFWTIPTENGFWRLSDRLTPAMTQDDAANYRSENGFQALSAEELFEVFGELYSLRNKGGEIEGARQFLKQAMRNNYPMTQTRVIYTSNGKDIVTHGYGTDSAVERKANILGPDGAITDVLSEEASKTLTGKTPDEVSELIDYINKTSAYVWRVNPPKPLKNDERVVGLGAGSVGADLNAGGDPRVAVPYLGGRFSREAPN